MCVCVCSSINTHRTEFIHETNRIRGDYGTGISRLLGLFGESCTLQKTELLFAQNLLKYILQYVLQLAHRYTCSRVSLITLNKLSCKDLKMTSGM